MLRIIMHCSSYHKEFNLKTVSLINQFQRYSQTKLDYSDTRVVSVRKSWSMGFAETKENSKNWEDKLTIFHKISAKADQSGAVLILQTKNELLVFIKEVVNSMIITENFNNKLNLIYNSEYLKILENIAYFKFEIKYNSWE